MADQVPFNTAIPDASSYLAAINGANVNAAAQSQQPAPQQSAPQAAPTNADGSGSVMPDLSDV